MEGPARGHQCTCPQLGFAAATMQVAIHLTHHMQGPLRTEPSEAECILALALFLDFRFRGLDAGTVTMAADACAAAVGPPGTLPAAFEASLSLSQLSQPKPPLCRRMLVGSFCSSFGALALRRGCAEVPRTKDLRKPCSHDAVPVLANRLLRLKRAISETTLSHTPCSERQGGDCSQVTFPSCKATAYGSGCEEHKVSNFS